MRPGAETAAPVAFRDFFCFFYARTDETRGQHKSTGGVT